MKRIILFAALIFGAGMAMQAAPASARTSKPVDCELVVKGNAYIQKICQYYPEKGGSFQIADDDSGYFADVRVDGAVGSVNWNEDPKATHAQAYLGEAKRTGACWIGTGFKVCARALPPAREKAIMASQPDGAALFPVLAGTLCIAPQGPLGPQTDLMLESCKLPTDNIFVRKADGALGISRHPELCISVEAPGMMKPPRLIADTCRGDEPHWTTGATSAIDDVVRSSDGLCLAVPNLDDENAEWPRPITVVSCKENADGAMRFIMEKS